MNVADQILNTLTIDEKISLLSGNGVWQTKDFSAKGLPSVAIYDGPHGLRKQDNSASINLGSQSARTVCFPCACATANSWDEQLLFELGDHLGELARSEQVDILLGPGVNIKRNPLCGRNFEYFSEDPLLSGKLGAAWIKGLQSHSVGSSVKHFCANNQETQRMSNSSVVDERTLREIYLKPFEIAVKEASPATVMCSYNRLNGIHLSDNKRLLKDILVDEWGFSGFVMTDWGAMNNRVAAIRARLALEMPGSGSFFDESVRSALHNGDITESDLDDCLWPMVSKILELKTNQKPLTSVRTLDEHHRFARTVAAQSAVLLKNDRLLPLDQAEKICVIGAFAENPHFQGAGSSAINPYMVDSLLAGLREHQADVTFCKGFELYGETPQTMISEALSATAGYDTVVFAAGLPDVDESEGFDRDNMRLPTVQDELITRICALGKKVAVILSAGSPVELPWTDQVSAILHMHLGGESAGSACADLLFGTANPCGKLAESYPLQYADHITSSFWLESERQSFYKEGLFVGYRYFDSAAKAVRFPFGHGLSYTEFSYSNLMITPNQEAFTVTFTIQNTGNFAGAEIAQVYISDQTKTVFKPEQELRAFRKIALAPGERATITIQLPRDAFAHYDANLLDWQVCNSDYEIRIGASSRDIRLRETVPVSFGRSYTKTAQGWYSSLVGTPQLADLQLLFKEQIAIEPPYRRGHYDINASLSQLARDSWFVRLMYRFTERFIAHGMGIKPDYNNPEFKMMVASSQASALRNLMLISPANMKKGLARFILRTANGLFSKTSQKNSSRTNEPGRQHS